jgi:hypothetical protein
MTLRRDRIRGAARTALAGIRLAAGTAGLFAPAFLIRRLGLDPQTDPAAVYALRLFGVRTILIGADLVTGDEAQRTRSLRQGVLIHGSDVTAAVLAGLGRQLPPKAAATAALISSANLGLALLARGPDRSGAGGTPPLVPALAAPGVLAPPAGGALTVDDLLSLSQQDLDDVFRTGTAGAIPDGDAEGTVLAASETLFVPARLLDRGIALLVRSLAWSGKVFDAARGELVNKVTPLQLRAVKARVSKGPSWYDGREAIILDYSRTSLLARRVRDEIRLVGPGTYLGQAYWGGTRVLQFALVFPSPVGEGRR